MYIYKLQQEAVEETWRRDEEAARAAEEVHI